MREWEWGRSKIRERRQQLQMGSTEELLLLPLNNSRPGAPDLHLLHHPTCHP